MYFSARRQKSATLSLVLIYQHLDYSGVDLRNDDSLFILTSGVDLVTRTLKPTNYEFDDIYSIMGSKNEQHYSAAPPFLAQSFFSKTAPGSSYSEKNPKDLVVPD